MGVPARSGRLLAVAVVWMLGLLAPCGPVAAQELREGPGGWRRDAGEDGGAWGFRKGRQEVGVLVGYGFEIDASGSSKSDMIKSLEFTLVRPRWGLFLTDRIGEGLLEGHLELLVEPAFLLSTTPTRRTGYELSVLFRYHFATGSRWVPFLSLGAGIIEENFGVAGRHSAGFNFTPQGGPGVSYFLDRNLAVSLEWRLYHVSNANTHTPNVGLNISFVLLGLSIFF
jgi:opacity protein-like surface antigen